MKKIKTIITELKKTERGKAILKLSGYMMFFIPVLLLVSINTALSETNNDNTIQKPKDETTPVVEEIKKLTYLEKQEKLYNSDYDYTYKVTGELNVIYSGSVTSGLIEGYKESAYDTIRYRIENDKIYELKLDEKIEIDTLYQGLDANLFDFETIFGKLNTKSTIIDRNELYKTYTYENIDGYKYVIYLTNTEIIKMVINNQHLTYEFTFEY